MLLFLLLACIAAAPTSRPAEIEPRCRALLEQWQGRFDEEHFSAIVAPPFVIAGDGGAAKLIGYRDRTILAAAEALQRMYFEKHPAEPVLILLFESAGPYRRLAALQKAIRADTLRSLAEMIEDTHFRADERVGMNYAHARYPLMYLQDQGLLSDYYASFRDGVADDPTGLLSLKRALQVEDLADFEPRWRRWVLSLRFPE